MHVLMMSALLALAACDGDEEGCEAGSTMIEGICVPDADADADADADRVSETLQTRGICVEKGFQTRRTSE